VKWRLIIAAILIFGLASAGLYLSKQGSYTSSAGIWVDRPIYTPADPGQNQYVTPATVQAGIFDQLLQTHQFTLQIAKNASIPMRTVNAEDAAVADLQKNLYIDPVGPNLIRVTYTSNKPQYVKPVLDAAISLFKDASTSSSIAQLQEAKKLYQQQLNTANQDMNKSHDAVNAYIQAHPDSTKNGSNDPTFNALNGQYQSDQQHVDDIQAKIDDLDLRINGKTQLSDIIFNVVDSPTEAEPYQFSVKDLIRNEAMALILGIVAVVGLTMVFTWTDQSVYTLNDISSLPINNDEPEASKDLLVGVVPYVKSLASMRRDLVKREEAKSSRRRGRKPRVTVVEQNGPTSRASADGVVTPIEALPDGTVVAGGRARR